MSERFKNQITIINEDILKISEHSISNDELIVFGNLPYNISTRILSKWIISAYNKKWYKSLILMFQKEVANRILAKTNSKKLLEKYSDHVFEVSFEEDNVLIDVDTPDLLKSLNERLSKEG